MKPVLASIASASASTAGNVVVKSFNGDAVNFFNSLRTPAALVAAAAIKDAFAMGKPEDIAQSRPWMILRTTYILLQLLAFSTEISCVFIASHAIVQLQMSHGISEVGKAASLIALMKSPQFEYEYVSVRASFMTGLLAFTTATALRARMALRRSKELSWAAMWFLLSAVAALLSYNNSQSITYGGYFGLLTKWIGVNVELMSQQIRMLQPSPMFAVLAFGLGCLTAMRWLYAPARQLRTAPRTCTRTAALSCWRPCPHTSRGNELGQPLPTRCPSMISPPDHSISHDHPPCVTLRVTTTFAPPHTLPKGGV